jgi:hypothetical protein
MRRREFITVIAGAATYPVAPHAQQSSMPLIGFLNSASAEQWEHRTEIDHMASAVTLHLAAKRGWVDNPTQAFALP